MDSEELTDFPSLQEVQSMLRQALAQKSAVVTTKTFDLTGTTQRRLPPLNPGRGNMLSIRSTNND